MSKTHVFEVQVGKGKGKYQSKYTFTGNHTVLSRALLYYHGINVHSGYKKRLLKDGKVIERLIT